MVALIKKTSCLQPPLYSYATSSVYREVANMRFKVCMCLNYSYVSYIHGYISRQAETLEEMT